MLATVLPAQAEVTWNQVKQKIKSAKDYSVSYKYNGPSGIFDFDYRFAGDKVRTEIVDSKSDRSRRGTVIIYDKSWKADKIRAKTGGGMIIRNLTHKDVKGKPFHESLFGIILKQTDAAGKPRQKPSETKPSLRSGPQTEPTAFGPMMTLRSKRQREKTAKGVKFESSAL